MSWEYRRIDVSDEYGEPTYEICEVFYNDLRQPIAYAMVEVISQEDDNFVDLILGLHEAIDKPVMFKSDFVEELDDVNEY